MFKSARSRLRAAVFACAAALGLGAYAATVTGYEDFGDVAGVVLYRATQTTFHNSTVINVAGDGTLGTAYAMDAGNNNTTSWKRFASNQGASCYTSPGTVLVYDEAGSYTVESDAQFGPMSFGGIWVKSLAANDAVFAIKGSGDRKTEFGAADKTTLFKFDKSFKIDRQGTFSFLGTVNLAVAQDAVFTINPSYPAQSIVVASGSTLAPSGAGTITLNTAGLTVNGTLDLTASTLPTISGNVRFASGSSLVLPAGIATGEAISFPVCSGTLTADGVVSVKIGTADPINAALTISGGTITQIDEAVVEQTFTSDYPSVVPAGYIYTFTTSAATTLPSVTVNGTLKTEGDFSITDLNVAASGAIDVVSGNMTVGGAATKQLSGNITVRFGATLTNTLTDSLNYSGSMTVDIYGTLAMGATRWSIPDGCTFKVHGGATVTGTGDGYGVLDFLAANDRGLDVYAASSASSVTIEGAVRVRNNLTRIWVAGNTTLVLQGGIVEKNQQPGSFKQTGPGTLELAATSTSLTGTSQMTQGTLRLNNTTRAFPLELHGSASLEIVATDAATTVPVNVTSINGNGVTLTGNGKANGTITKTAAPSGNLATFLQSSAWEGTFVADWAGANGTRFDINSYGNANSTVRVTKLVGGYVSGSNANVTVVPTVEVSGFMTLDNGYSGKVTTLTKLTGSGVFTNTTYSVDVTTLDNFTGTLATLIGTQYIGMRIGTINLSSTPAAGAKIVNVTSDSNIGNIANTKVSVNGVVDDTIALEVKSDGIYVVEENIDVTVPVVANTVVTVTVGGETVSPTTEGGNVYAVAPGSVVTVTYAAADGYEISGTTVYTVDTANATTFEVAADMATAQYVAQIRTGATTYEKYTTLAAALDSENIAYGITLLADVTENNVTVDSAATITGNHTINANVTIANGGQLQLMLATLNGTLTIQSGGTYVTIGGTLGNVVVQDGGIINLTTLSEDAAPLTVSTLTVNGALTIVSTYGLAERGKTYKAISYVTGNATIAEGASFNGSGEWSASTTVDGDNTVVCLEITKVAVVDGVYYDTAQEAVEAAVASGKQAEFLVQPGTVKLGAGETLVVKGGYQPTVELDAGLSTPPYEVESGYDITTGIYTYAVKSYVAQIGDDKYESIAAAVAAATSGQTVKLLADVTLTDKLVVSNKTVTITADSAKTITGQLRVVDGSNVTIGENVTITSDKHPTVFVLGDPAVKTAGTAKSVLVVNGTVLNTNAGFDQTFAIAGNGVDTKGVDITINGTVRNANGIAIYKAFPGDLVVNGTVEGASAISIKDGTLTVNSGASVRATLASGVAYVGNNNGESPTGDAIIAPYYDLSLGYGTPVVSIAGGEITVTDTENCTGIEAYDFEGATAPNDSASNVNVSGGTFNTAVADTYCAEGFEPKDNGDGTYGVREDKGWVYSAPGYWDYTGTWTEGAALGDDKVTISDGATYSNRTASAGQLVTVAMTLSFDDVNDDDSDFGDAKAAIRLASGETDGTYQFQLYTSDGANKVWTNATVVGVAATKEEDYNFVFVLDLTNKIYTASVVSGATTNALTIGENVTEIPFACQGEITPVQQIDFVGAGKVSSIEGSYEDAPEPEGFVENQVIGVVTLTSEQAEWLNGQGNYDALAEKIATMSQTALDNAYLLNLNIAGDFSYEFGVSDFKVDTAAGTATVYVTLTRTGALAENEVAKPIIGTLKLTGTAEIGTAFAEIGSADLTFDANADFGDGATTTAVTVDIGENGTGAKFYLPVIE